MRIRDNKNTFWISAFIATVLAISPILDPYKIIELGSFLTIRVMDVFLIFLVILIILYRKEIVIPKISIAMYIMLITFFLLTLFAFAYNTILDREFGTSLKLIIIWSVYLFLVSFLWKYNDFEKFKTYSIRISILLVSLVIIQFLFVNLGFSNFWDGKIPFLQLGRYDQWAGLIDPNTGDIRVHGFLQEPSYVGIYLLPVLAYLIIKEKYILSIFIFIGLIITSSLIAIIGGIITAVYIFLIKSNLSEFKIKSAIKASFFFIILTLAVVSLWHLSDNAQNIINYSVQRFISLETDLSGDRMGSTKIRLLGYSIYFGEIPTVLQIIGLGAGQFPTYFSNYGVHSYSSTLVTILLNFGIIGISTFIGLLIFLYLKSDRISRVYIIIFAFICAVDSFWFNWYFYYILAWYFGSYLSEKRKSDAVNKSVQE